MIYILHGFVFSLIFLFHLVSSLLLSFLVSSSLKSSLVFFSLLVSSHSLLLSSCLALVFFSLVISSSLFSCCLWLSCLWLSLLNLSLLWSRLWPFLFHLVSSLVLSSNFVFVAVFLVSKSLVIFPLLVSSCLFFLSCFGLLVSLVLSSSLVSCCLWLSLIVCCCLFLTHLVSSLLFSGYNLSSHPCLISSFHISCHVVSSLPRSSLSLSVLHHCILSLYPGIRMFPLPHVVVVIPGTLGNVACASEHIHKGKEKQRDCMCSCVSVEESTCLCFHVWKRECKRLQRVPGSQRAGKGQRSCQTVVKDT